MSQNIRERGSAAKSRSDFLPPPRDRRKATVPISPPLSRVPLHRFMYYLAIFSAILISFYAWRIFQWKTEVGGWANLALRRHPPAETQNHAGTDWRGGASIAGTPQTRSDASVEQRIDELAAALGIPSKELAAAIAGAVREHAPPASFSSIAAHETGEAAKYLVDPTSASDAEAEGAAGATAIRGIKAVASAFEAVVGLDEPPSGLDSQ